MLSLEVDVEGDSVDKEKIVMNDEKILIEKKVRRTERQRKKPDKLMYN